MSPLPSPELLNSFVYSAHKLRMKKISLAIALISITSLLRAQEITKQEITKQEKGYFNITEIGFFYGENNTRVKLFDRGDFSQHLSSNIQVYSLRSINGIFLNNHLSVGLGLGLDGIDETKSQGFYNTFLIFADGRYYFGTGKSGYFAYGDVGQSVAIDQGFQKGLMYNAGGGYKFMLGRHTAMNASVGYNQQHIKSVSWIKQRIPSMSFKVGLMF